MSKCPFCGEEVILPPYYIVTLEDGTKTKACTSHRQQLLDQQREDS